jgi:hypothetical protein
MKTTVLKKKLKNDFEKILEDETKLETLETVLGEIIEEIENTETISNGVKSDKTNSGKSDVRSWEDFKNKMKTKYGY